MEVIKMDVLEQFISTSVELTIQDIEGEDKAPFIKKQVKKLELCPDQTHLRIYFDLHHFLAIPVTSEVTFNNNIWVAYDSFSKLNYVIRKGSENHG